MDLLKDLIRIDSSTREMANTAIEYASDYLRQQGLEGKILDNNGYKSYITTIGKGDKTLVLNGHLDVVSGKVSQFNPIEADGKIFGRGSADMKGGCVAMMQTMIELKDEDLKSKIMLQLVPDEEVGGRRCQFSDGNEPAADGSVAGIGQRRSAGAAGGAAGGVYTAGRRAERTGADQLYPLPGAGGGRSRGGGGGAERGAGVAPAYGKTGKRASQRGMGRPRRRRTAGRTGPVSGAGAGKNRPRPLCTPAAHCRDLLNSTLFFYFTNRGCVL